MEDRGLSIEEIQQDMEQETAEENTYTQLPVPTIEITGVEGRRLTMDYGSTLLTYMENATGSHTNQPSNLMEQINARLLGLRSRQHPIPEYNKGFEDDDGNTLDDDGNSTIPKHPYGEGERNGTENVYDSLKLSKSVDKIYDTKL